MPKELQDLLKKIYAEKRKAKEEGKWGENNALTCEILGLVEGYLFGLSPSQRK